MKNLLSNITEKLWFYLFIYVMFFMISFLPLYSENPFPPQETPDVIISLLMISLKPYSVLAIIFHIATLVFVIISQIRPKMMNRALPAFIGFNYLVIALTQSIGRTEKYGLVIYTGQIVISILLGIIWIGTSISNSSEVINKKILWYHIILLPLAIISFWSPYQVVGSAVRPNFNSLLLLISPDYGLSFCFTTPVFLYILMLFYSPINSFAVRITSFTGMLFAFFNLTHWFHPDSRWMGFLHLPLLIISIILLVISHRKSKKY